MPVHNVDEPPLTVIPPGAAGKGLVATATVLAVLLPQPFVATTVIFPAEAPAVTVMLLVDEVPVQPCGNVQLYNAAPATAAIK